ncbi:hypothetical protein DIPPA_31686 [Diplonema papillatum]|nr:hypothetical protein DIPPA_31686 [Diplonema papillatum]
MEDMIRDFKFNLTMKPSDDAAAEQGIAAAAEMLKNLDPRFGQASRNHRRRGAVCGEDVERLAKQLRGMRTAGAARGSTALIRRPATAVTQLRTRYAPYQGKSYQWDDAAAGETTEEFSAIAPYLYQLVEVAANGANFQGRLTGFTRPHRRSPRRALRLTNCSATGGVSQNLVSDTRIFLLEDVSEVVLMAQPVCITAPSASSIEMLDEDEPAVSKTPSTRIDILADILARISI